MSSWQNSRADVAIVGGGVIGCAIAYELGRRGRRVTLLERERVGAEASSAAAGMLAPLAEAFGPGAPSEHDAAFDASVALAVGSLRRFPSLVDELRETTGIDAGLIQTGMVRLFEGDLPAATLAALLDLAAEHGLRVQPLDAQQLAQAQPGLADGRRSGLLSLDEHQVDAPAYVQALAAAARATGATILEGTPVTGARTQGDRLLALKTTDGELVAEQFVFAAGAWSAALQAWLGLAVPVFPVRGQVLAIRNTLGLRYTLYGPNGYLVPKANGTIVVGATAEPVGFAKRVTVNGIGSILRKLADLLPAAGEAEVLASWSGLRPATPDHLPILGRAGDLANAFLATGHYRNGILLSAATGEVMADLLIDQPVAGTLAPFDARRFNRLPVG